MSVHAAADSPVSNFIVHARDLRMDHRLFRQLLERFELHDQPMVRRDIMQLVVDLFDLHSAIEEQVFPVVHDLSLERDAVYDLMEQVEGTDARSQLHFARGLELKRAFEIYIEKEESQPRRIASRQLERTRSNRTLLQERMQLIAQAEQLLRLH
ncbi:MAG: hypothetical protein JWR07_1418 [Nevskia sp.]|nr:hypothetical protein [Nevskia sp.]